MYMIVVGAGGIGNALVEIALRDRHNVAVIERDPRKAEAISRKFDALILNADAASVDVLREAGAERADALIATTSDDATNLMVIVLGGDLGIPSLVSVVNNREHTELFRRLGANVMENPEVIVAEYLYNAVHRPKIKDLVTLSGGAQVFRAAVTEKSPLVGRTLREAGQRGLVPNGVLIAAIERSGETIIPSGTTAIEAGDLITVFSKEHATNALIEQLTG
ncbi:MAG TPA: TrkA family potassium uptake protein [Candidatus Acetothermia bacterium]|nr:TrkA family potassium uptake protein [Candidatus Acetothermia bacterium]